MKALLTNLYPPTLNGVEVEIIQERGDYPPRDLLITVRILDPKIEKAHGYTTDIRVPTSCLTPLAAAQP